MSDLTDTGRALASSSLVAFVGVCDPDRAKRFYRDTLGLHLVREELPFALVFDVQGTMLRVTVVPEVKPAKFTVLGWKVPDIQAAVSSLEEEGVEFQRYAGLQQDGLGIWTSPNGARVAWFHDLDGNILSVTQF